MITDEYDIDKTIAEGYFAKIFLTNHKPTKSCVVLKACHMELTNVKEFIREFHYNYQLSHHPQILSCYQVNSSARGISSAMCGVYLEDGACEVPLMMISFLGQISNDRLLCFCDGVRSLWRLISARRWVIISHTATTFHLRFNFSGSSGLPESCCKKIADQLSSALGFMHIKSLVHRDLKLGEVHSSKLRNTTNKQAVGAILQD